MKLGHDLDSITYVGSPDGKHSTYRVILEGRPVMDVLADDATGVVRIALIGPDDLPRQIQDTRFVASFEDILAEYDDGTPMGVVHQISERSVYSYVLPRLHVLIARLLLPLA